MRWLITRGRYEDLAARYQQAVADREDLADQLKAEQEARRTIAIHYHQADTTAIRLDGHIKRLQEHCRVLEDQCLAEQHARELIATQHHEEVLRFQRENVQAPAVPGSALQQRLARALRACARYRIQVATRDRVIAAQQRQHDVLQRQLDDALGLDTAEIRAGAHWQQRRADKQGLVS